MIILFSPSGVDSLKMNFPDFEQENIKIGTLGNSTAKAVEDAGLRLDFRAPTPECPSITGALENFLKTAGNNHSK